jgi:hypothetical protein
VVTGTNGNINEGISHGCQDMPGNTTVSNWRDTG